jgi:hypothetical protein
MVEDLFESTRVTKKITDSPSFGGATVPSVHQVHGVEVENYGLRSRRNQRGL